MRHLIPVLAPLPRRAWMVLVGMLLPAWLLLCPANAVPGTFPGDPDLPDGPIAVNTHWQVQTFGLASYVADDLHGYPFRTDRSVVDGIPLDALGAAPLCWLFGLHTGLWLWAIGVAWAAGAGAAWLGMRWWGTLSAGIVCGAGFLVAEVALREVGEGRSTLAFVFLAPALAAGVAAARGGTRSAIAAGVFAGIGTLAQWVFVLPLLACALAPSLPFRRGLATLASFAAVVAFPAAWVLSGRNEVPSLGMDAWSPALLDFQQVRPVDLGLARIHGGVLTGTLGRPVLIALVGWSLWKARARHVWVPALIGITFAILGLGAYLPGPVVLPWGWLQSLPGLSRAWWPDRWWVVVSLALCLIAAGARLPLGAALLCAVGLLEEAVLLSPALPFSAIELRPSSSAKALARVPDVPLVLLPLGEGRFRTDRLDLVDQIAHARPLAQGTASSFDLGAPDALLRSWRTNHGLRALAACELGRPAEDLDRVTFDLVHAGLREVWLDPRYLGSDATYATCVETVLAGWSRSEEDPLVRYRAP